MTWQGYQDGVAELYAQMDQMGRVCRNIHRPDKDTGRPRQIDLWMECDFKGMTMGVLVDAKFHEEPIDVNTVEQVVMLAEAVKAHMSVIVAPNGFTEGALAKAKACKMHCRIWTLEEALEFMVEDFWIMCPVCEQDCIPLDQNGAVQWNRMWLWWLAGSCRKCHAARVWCQSCGIKMMILAASKAECTCGLVWEVTADGDVLPPEEADNGGKPYDPHPGHPTFW
jgi:hypothetical protein